MRLRIGDFFFLFLLFTGQVFDVTGRETFVYDLFCKLDLLFAGRKSEERARLAGRELAFDHELFHFIGEIRETEHIGDVGAAFADLGRHLLLRQPIMIHQLLIGFTLFDRVQVFALQILDQRHLCHGSVIIGRNDRRHCLEPCEVRRPQTALAGDELILKVAVLVTVAHRDRLDQSFFLDGSRQIFQRLKIKLAARLPGIGMDLGNIQLNDLARLIQCIFQKRAEPPSQFSLNHVSIPPGTASYTPLPPWTWAHRSGSAHRNSEPPIISRSLESLS